jgi:hypothetical protein
MASRSVITVGIAAADQTLPPSAVTRTAPVLLAEPSQTAMQLAAEMHVTE